MNSINVISLIINGKEENASAARDVVELEKHDQVIQSKGCSCTHKEHASICEIQHVIVEVENNKKISRYAVEMAFCSECCCYFIPQKSYELLLKKGKIGHKIVGGKVLYKYMKNGPDFQEEKIFLDKIVKTVNSELNSIPVPTVGKYAIDDGCGGLISHATLKQEAINYSDKRQEIKRKLQEPYIGRIDVSDKGRNKIRYYIGRAEDKKIGNVTIYARWSDQGQLFGRDDDQRGIINGVEKQVDLRRKIDISDGKLLGIQNVYSGDSEFAKKGKYDKFLIEIIKKRKKNHHPTDIIDSIQKKQNDIIEKAYTANVIVQGCAGSGKTMVMLHRLSFWLYNNKSLKPEKIRIITPSEGFNEHIETLLYQLNIANCQINSIGQYYNTLLGAYDKKLMYDGNLGDEESVNERFVNYVYSQEFKKLFRRKYNSIISRYALEEEISIIENTASKCGFRVPDMKHKSMGDVIESIARLSHEIINKNKKSESDRKRIQDKIDQEEEIIKKCKYEIQQAQLTINQYNKNYKEELSELLGVCIESCNKTIMTQKNEESLIVNNDDNQMVISLENEAIIGADKRVKELRKSIKKHEELLEKMSSLLMIIPFSSSIDMIVEMIDNSIVLKNEEHIARYLRQYRDAASTITKQELLVKNSGKTIDSEKDKLASVEMILTNSERDDVSLLCDKYPDWIIIGIFEEVYNETIKEKLAELDLEKKAGTYRFDLYVRVMFAELLWNKTVGKDEIICIDEAQDLSIGEYDLIIEQNKSNHTYYNIFGDLKQRIKKGRGLNSWEHINQKLIGHIYELNENYRNTNQITTYCNDNLKIDEMTLTGVDGADVRQIGFDKMISELTKIGDTDERIVVIAPRSFSKQKITNLKVIRQMNERVSTKFDPQKISIMYVDEVKGIEFDRVYVVDSDMDNNEKYIAYTRALDHLTIVR